MRTALWIATTLWLATAALAAAADPPPPPWAPTADGRASFTTLLSPGVAPAAIHVSGLTCPLAVGTPLTARYEWDFGDPAGLYDHLVGFVAAHCYDRPGTYHITLAVTDEAGHRGTAQSTITIAPDVRRAYYVSADGSDANPGDDEEHPLRSAVAAFAKLSGSRGHADPGHAILLFKAGGTYPADTTLTVRGPDVVVGRYGRGEPPVLLLSRGPPDAHGRSGHGSISIDGHCDGVMIQHLTFATPYAVPATAEAPKVGIAAITCRGRNVSVRGCTFHDVDDAVSATGNPAGLYVQGCDAPGPVDLRGYLIWGQGTDHCYLGNHAVNSTREHNVRMTNLDRVLIFDNDLRNMNRSDVDKYDGIKGSIEMHAGRFAYVVGNRVRDGPVRTGPRGGNGEPPTSATDWCVVDGNDLTDSAIRVDPGSHHTMVRNNVLHRSNGTFVEVDKTDGYRTTDDLTVAHNTAVDTGTTGIFLKVWGRVNGLALADNLFVAPGLRVGTEGTAAVNVFGDTLDGFTAVSHDVWPVPASAAFPGAAGGVCVLGTSPDKVKNYRTAAAWAAVPPVDGDRFATVTVDDRGRPSAGPADGAAVAVPGTAFDHDGRPRPPAGPQTAGAFERDAAGPGTMPAVR